PRPPACALRRQAPVLTGSLSDQGLSLSAHRSREVGRKGRRFRNRSDRARLHAARDSRTCPSSISASSSRGQAGARGKGAGFADLEHGLFRKLGLVSSATPIATTVHSSQVVANSEVVMENHDSALHYIATELELIATRTEHPQPKGVDWDKVRPDQFADIPFL